MLWVKSSQRRNSPRINRFQQENRGRERKGLGRRRMRFGEKNITTLSLYPSLWLCISLYNTFSHLFCSCLSLLRPILSFLLSPFTCLWFRHWFMTACSVLPSPKLAGYVCHAAQLQRRDLNCLWPKCPEQSIQWRFIWPVFIYSVIQGGNSDYLSLYLWNHSFIHFLNDSLWRCPFTDGCSSHSRHMYCNKKWPKTNFSSSGEMTCFSSKPTGSKKWNIFKIF